MTPHDEGKIIFEKIKEEYNLRMPCVPFDSGQIKGIE